MGTLSKKQLISAGLILFLLVSIPLVIILVRQRQNLKPKAAQPTSGSRINISDSNNLELQGEPNPVSTSDKVNLKIFYDPGITPTGSPTGIPISTPPPVTPTIPVTTPTPVPSTGLNRVFITNATFTGNLGGLAGADIKCQTAATTAKLGGNWKAWISAGQESASTRLVHKTTVYKLINNTVVANNWTDLTDGSLQNLITTTESGVATTGNVWTNTLGNGNVSNPDSSAACDAGGGFWTASVSTGNIQSFGGISTNSSNNFWTYGVGAGCQSTYHLYCFEQ